MTKSHLEYNNILSFLIYHTYYSLIGPDLSPFAGKNSSGYIFILPMSHGY